MFLISIRMPDHRDCCSELGHLRLGEFWAVWAPCPLSSRHLLISVLVFLCWCLCYPLPFFLLPPSFSLTDSACSVLCLAVHVHIFVCLSVSFPPFLSANVFGCAPESPRRVTSGFIVTFTPERSFLGTLQWLLLRQPSQVSLCAGMSSSRSQEPSEGTVSLGTLPIGLHRFACLTLTSIT